MLKQKYYTYVHFYYPLTILNTEQCYRIVLFKYKLKIHIKPEDNEILARVFHMVCSNYSEFSPPKSWLANKNWPHFSSSMGELAPLRKILESTLQGTFFPAPIVPPISPLRAPCWTPMGHLNEVDYTLKLKLIKL